MTLLRTGEPSFRRLIDAVAAFEALPRWKYRGGEFTPGELLEGLILTESSGNPEARRYEPHQDAPGRKDQARDPDTLAQDDGPREDDASYGLMQVMGYNVKAFLRADRPVGMDFTLLYQPLMGLAFGLAVLKAELRAVYQAHPHIEDSEKVVRALARYNGGPTGDAFDPETSDIRRRPYVDKVHANATRAREDRVQSRWRV